MRLTPGWPRMSRSRIMVSNSSSAARAVPEKIAPNSQWNQPTATPRYIGLACRRAPSEPSGSAWDSIMCWPITWWAGTKASSIRTLFEPDARMPMKRSSPQSGRISIFSRGATKNTGRGAPPSNSNEPPMKWVETGMPEAKGQTPETR